MATQIVSHGRRKGSLRTTPEAIAREQTPLRSGQVAVVSGTEWLRICESVRAKDDGKPRPQNDRDALHEKSKSIVKNWENTIEGQRLKKLQARKIREEKEELERVQVDIEEAKFQAEKRKEAIERAKTLLYYQTDRVKQFHGALLLSEVLLERDKQVEYKQKKMEAIKQQDAKYIEAQAAQREIAIQSDMEAAKRRAREKNAVSKFQISQAAVKSEIKAKTRQSALNEQEQLDEQVKEFHQQQRELESKQYEDKLAHRRALDEVLKQKRERERAVMENKNAEEEEIRIFAKAKKKMTQLRKEKEEELFHQFQTHQQRMCDLLQSQMAQATSDEDERIARAIAEQQAKREAEEHAKELKFIKATQSINRHMLEQMSEKERKRIEQEEMDAELLKQRIIQDQKFHSQQLDKYLKTAREAQERQEFLELQMSELGARKQALVKDERDYNDKNMELLKIEEAQFQQYANDVINKAKSRGAPTQPLSKAAKPGAGGGHGRVFSRKGGIRPSYQAMDSTAVELPSYIQKPAQTKNTQNRMGFTW